MSLQVVNPQQSSVYCKCLQEWGNLQSSGMEKTFIWIWLERNGNQVSEKTSKHVHQKSLPPIIVPVLVAEVLQYYMDSPQADTMPMLLAWQLHPGSEAVCSY